MKNPGQNQKQKYNPNISKTKNLYTKNLKTKKPEILKP